MRFAKLQFYPGPHGPVVIPPSEVNVDVIRVDPAIDAIVGPNPKMYKLAEGFKFTEDPVWVPNGRLSAVRRSQQQHHRNRGSPGSKRTAVRRCSNDSTVPTTWSPNGLAFSPDEKYFYLADWDEKRKVLMRYEVQADGTFANGKVFFDFPNGNIRTGGEGPSIRSKAIRLPPSSTTAMTPPGAFTLRACAIAAAMTLAAPSRVSPSFSAS